MCISYIGLIFLASIILGPAIIILPKRFTALRNRDKENLIKQYDEIIEQKERDRKNAETVIRSIAEGLVVVDVNGNVVMMNHAAEKILGTSQKNKIGKPILEDIKKEHLVSLVTDYAKKECRKIELTDSEDETKKIIRSSSAVIENESGQTVGIVSVLSNVTKQKKLDQLKSDFVSKVSHELKTPIITIRNVVTLLLGESIGHVNEKQEEFLKISKRSLDRLILLVNDLLDQSKLEASKVELKMAPSSIEKLINDACDTLNAWVITKSIKLEKKIQKNIPEIQLDYNRIVQVLNNIIGNAIKFTPQGGFINIEAGLEDSKENIFISISNNGPSILEKDLGKLFDKFYQGGERALTDTSGTGLGLSIAKEIVLLHKGKIWAENTKEQGVKFSFTLPI